MNKLAADHVRFEPRCGSVRCATADHAKSETHTDGVGRHSFAADHKACETQRSGIRCRRQATTGMTPIPPLPAANLLPMGQRPSETHCRPAHRSTADHLTIETQRGNVGRHLLPMGHARREIHAGDAHRNRRRIIHCVKSMEAVSAADLSPHRTRNVLKPISPLSGAAN